MVREPGDDKQRGKIQGKLQGVIDMETPCIEGGFQEVKYPELKQIDFGYDSGQFNQGFDAEKLGNLAVSFACHQESDQQDDDAGRHDAISPVAMREQEIFLHLIQ